MAISLRLDTGRRTAVATATRLPRYARNDIRGQSKDSAAHAYPLYCTTNGHHRLTCTHFTPPPTGAAGSLVPALICHCEERPLIPSSSRDVAISMRLDTRRRTVVATATRLPRYARNDKVGTHEALPGSVEHVATPSAKSRPLPAWKMAKVRSKPAYNPRILSIHVKPVPRPRARLRVPRSSALQSMDRWLDLRKPSATRAPLVAHRW